MKTLGQIIDEIQDGGRPDYEDLRYAVLALSALRHFDSNALRKLHKRESEGKYKPAMFGLEWEAKESFDRYKRALAVPPKQYVGKEHDPDQPECQQFRAFAKKLVEKVTKQSDQQNQHQ